MFTKCVWQLFFEDPENDETEYQVVRNIFT